MEKEKKYDLIVIGTGSAGVTVARKCRGAVGVLPL